MDIRDARGARGKPGEPGEEAVGQEGGKGGKGGEGGAGGTGDPRGRGGAGGIGGEGGRGAQGIQGPPGPSGPAGHTPIHKWRWRFLTLWVIGFSLLVGYALKVERNNSQSTKATSEKAQAEARRNDERFCRITQAYIASNQALRSAQNRSSIETIGQRQTLISAERQLLDLYAHTSTDGFNRSQLEMRKVIIVYLAGEIALNQAQIGTARDSLVAADKALGQWADLRRELRC